MIGVSSGTTSSRGVRAVSWKRRLASVASGFSVLARVCEAAIAISAVDIDALLSGSRGERAAGQPQVDVVQGRLAGAVRPRDPQLLAGSGRLPRAAVMPPRAR